MSRQYPIWIDVQACVYGSNKSYGAKDTNEQKILVGSSRTNSHELSTIINYKKRYHHEKYGSVISFRTKVDGIILNEMIFEDNNGVAGKLLKKRTALKRMKGL